MTRILVICASLLGLSACGGEVGMMLVGGSMASLTYSKKTLVDHAVSNYTELNCSILHTARNEEYCQTPEISEREKVAYMASMLYCYRTLGGVSSLPAEVFRLYSRVHGVLIGWLHEGLYRPV